MSKGKKKKRKKRASRRSPRKPTTRLVIYFILAAAVSASAILWLLQRKPVRPLTAPPAYEEVHSRVPPLQDAMHRLDKTIYEVLFLCGVSEKDVLFTNVGHRMAADRAWDFVEIEVSLHDEDELSRVASEMERRLHDLPSEIHWAGGARSSASTEFNFYVEGHHTHRVFLVLDRKAVDKPRPRRPRVALIIDDFGYDRGLARAFAEVEMPLSLAVLPMTPRTRDVAQIIVGGGKELLIHMPMEPHGYPDLNPGQGALLCHMDDEEIRNLVRAHLKEIPEASGVNNHMGSHFTEVRDRTSVFLKELRGRSLFFVDSMTSGRSKAYGLARELGIPAARRDVFLDNEPVKSAIDIQMEKLLGIARHRGSAVGIAHPFPDTLKALKSKVPDLEREVELVPVSELTR